MEEWYKHRRANRVEDEMRRPANRVDEVKEEAANRVDEAKEEEAYAIGGGGGIECGEGQVRGEGRRIRLEAVGLRKKVNNIRGVGVKRKAEEMMRVNRRYREREERVRVGLGLVEDGENGVGRVLGVGRWGPHGVTFAAGVVVV